ncbi:hypothetical protein [Catellatospora tritici]|uniref:hypothetical protein n=1 Tax=Catellatospora tritici TaxID=2851566 RepID=UPI001C2DB051|nr:hypothetical protein [Catellatospora tritici]MBV1850836.1 hypothetical protein [Catellatospora tritici]MBV1851089.1 hypothetical protein [Catellatospora tritici]
MTLGPAHAYRITKYDPADRDEHGHYQGPLDSSSDHGPVEAAYLAAVAAFAHDSGVDRLAVREPELAPHTLDSPAAAPDLRELFPGGVHDGAELTIDGAQRLVQAMLREDGIWCRLEHDDLLHVHVGWDQYLYIAAHRRCDRAVDQTNRLGLFVEQIPHSPYRHTPDDEDGQRRPADDTFWTELSALATRHGRLLIEEGYVHNAVRWHRVTAADLPDLRTRLAPRARLAVWPDLRDPAAVADGLPDSLFTIVWQTPDGILTGSLTTDTDHTRLRELLATATAATLLYCDDDQTRPLLAAVGTDPDGVLRARWSV